MSRERYWNFGLCSLSAVGVARRETVAMVLAVGKILVVGRGRMANPLLFFGISGHKKTSMLIEFIAFLQHILCLGFVCVSERVV